MTKCNGTASASTVCPIRPAVFRQRLFQATYQFARFCPASTEEYP